MNKRILLTSMLALTVLATLVGVLVSGGDSGRDLATGTNELAETPDETVDGSEVTEPLAVTSTITLPSVDQSDGALETADSPDPVTVGVMMTRGVVSLFAVI